MAKRSKKKLGRPPSDHKLGTMVGVRFDDELITKLDALVRKQKTLVRGALVSRASVVRALVEWGIGVADALKPTEST